MKYFIEESTLTGIGDAIRGKNGTSDLIPVIALADAITNLPTGGGGLPSAITTAFSYFNYGGHNDWICDLEQPITFTQDSATSVSSFFTNSMAVDASKLTFVFKGYPSTQMFSGCNAIRKLPNIYVSNKTTSSSLNQMFNYCRNLRNIPVDYLKRKSATGELLGDTWFTSLNGNNNTFIFRGCWSLRNIPDLTGIYYSASNGNYSQMFQDCSCLDEITTFIMPMSTSVTTTTNRFSNTFDKCGRLKRLVFPTQADGSPYVCSWSNQTIDLSVYVGYAISADNVIGYNSGCTADDCVNDATTYQALKDNEDYWTMDVNYSRYNYISALETINSLPDCSAAGTNTIKFKAGSGALTDGGAVDNLTEAEIAIAAAKGWTVTLV